MWLLKFTNFHFISPGQRRVSVLSGFFSCSEQWCWFVGEKMDRLRRNFLLIFLFFLINQQKSCYFFNLVMEPFSARRGSRTWPLTKDATCLRVGRAHLGELENGPHAPSKTTCISSWAVCREVIFYLDGTNFRITHVYKTLRIYYHPWPSVSLWERTREQMIIFFLFLKNTFRRRTVQNSTASMCTLSIENNKMCETLRKHLRRQ